MYTITLGNLVVLMLGLNMSWSAIRAALTLIFLDFKDARPCLEKVIIYPSICSYISCAPLMSYYC